MSEKKSMTEALEMVTIGELGFIERRFNKPMEELSGVQTTAGLIWALERRKPIEQGSPKFDWPNVEAMTMKEVNHYFAPESMEVDESEPESESGKDVSVDA